MEIHLSTQSGRYTAAQVPSEFWLTQVWPAIRKSIDQVLEYAQKIQAESQVFRAAVSGSRAAASKLVVIHHMYHKGEGLAKVSRDN